MVAALVLGVLLPQLRADLEIRHEALARTIAGQIETYLLGARRELRAVAENLRNHPRDLPASHWFGHLDAHTGTGDLFAAIYITDSDDSVYSVGLPQAERDQRGDLLKLDLSKWAALREARERNEELWSETFLSVVTGRLAVTLAIPVADQMLIGEIAIDRLSQFIGRSPAESGMVTMILDRRGQIIAHSQAALSGQQFNLGHLPIVRDALEGRFATRSFEWDGEWMVGTSVGVPQLGWIVLVAQPRIEAFRAFLSALWVLAAGALVALPLAILVAWALARGFAQRIGRYAEQAHAIAEGDYDQPWPISHIREFDGLAGDLDRMSLAIRQRERDLATSEARFRSVIGNAPVVLFQFDEHGIFTFSEGKGLAGIGLAAGEAVGQSVFELYRDYPEVCEHARRALGGESVRFNTRIGEVFLDVYASPVRDGGGHLQVMGVTVDITERQRAEEALRQANLVVENSPAMLFRWKAEDGWPVVFVSHNVKQLGYSPKELLDGSFRFVSLVHPEDLERIGHEIQAYAESGVDQFQQEYRIVAKDGAVRWIDDRTVVERNAEGEITHYQGIVIDITERKRAEESLRRTNRQLRMLSDCNQALIRITDEMELLTTICTITVQEGGYRMAWVGYAEHDVSKTIRPMAHAGFEEGYLQNLNITWADDERGLGPMGTAIRTKRPVPVQNIASDSRFAPWRAEAAKRGYAAVCALPLTASDQIFGALGIYSSAPDAFGAEEIDLLSELASDLTFGIAVLRTRIEHQRAEMALKEKTEELDRFFTVALDLLCIADTDGYFHRLNPQWEVVLGYSLSELKKERFLDLVHPDDQASTLAVLGELSTQKVVLNFVNRYRRKDGSYCWIEWKSYPIDNLVYAAARDITDRKRAEEELQRHREHLEELVAERTAELRQAMTQLVQSEKLAALGHLVAGVAHELNTPLGNSRVVASSLGETLREFEAGIESGGLRRSQLEMFLERSREAVDLLERNTSRAADLIGHFKQVAVDQTSARRRRFPLRQTVEELLATLQPQFKQTAHRVELDIPPDIELDSYPGPLEQVLANLMSNSLAHGFAGTKAGVIRVRAAPLDPDRVQIDYADDGVGIPETALDRIFEPFFTTKLGSGGSGLGLYIVYNLVTGALGGTIQVHGPPDHGASFTLVLPIIAPDPPDPRNR